MYPLLGCSFVVWFIIFERLWSYRSLARRLHSFYLEAMNVILRGELSQLQDLCRRNECLPTSQILMAALERSLSKDAQLRGRWREALERRRQVLNFELRKYLWLLGTIGNAAPFIGLFGTVVGILSAFQDMVRTGAGGFTVVASGISESLISTAAGIVVAVVAFVAFNIFQTQWSSIVMLIRIQVDELAEILPGLLHEHSKQ